LGKKGSGQLGLPASVAAENTPMPVSGLGSGVVAAVAGRNFGVALKGDGTVLAWGANRFGQIGDGTTTQRNSPVQVSGLGTGSQVIAVAGGGFHALALKSDGTALAWGNNGNGQLGDNTVTQRLTPVLVSGLGAPSGVIDVAAGQLQSYALR